MLLLAAAARPLHAESVYKCRGADGAIAFQDRPCAASQTQSLVDIAPPPPPAAAPDYGLAAHAGRRADARSRAPRAAREPRETMSYECRAADGELFYRHGRCPAQIPADRSSSRGSAKGKSAGYAVTAQPIARAEACRRIERAGSIGRSGHERDERVSTYDRNLGRDPCRYL
ncbi:MAG TPA: DUF4124 domain-containing protein [Rhodanobacteraceae bacterium]|nr:DUF4124 domain-containing protein [Rhodanobacteraceae bacterium]